MPSTIYSIEWLDQGPDITWTNVPSGIFAGPFTHPLGLYKHTAVGTGIPREIDDPTILIDADLDELPDFQIGPRQRWYVSERAKEILDQVDSDAFDWRRASARALAANGERVQVPDYYICDVVRFVDALDETRSRVTVRGPMRTVSVFGDQNTFLADRIGDHKVFRLMYSTSHVVCTEQFRRAVGDASLTNIQFRKMGMTDG